MRWVLQPLSWLWHCLPLSSPVFYYDLIRSARAGRQTLWRILYASALLLMILLLYLQWFPENVQRTYRDPYGVHRTLNETSRPGILAIFDPAAVPPAYLSRMAEAFFIRFLIVQLAVVFVLTPACTAPALADEKDRRTLEFLFTTHMGAGELVLGKLLSRLAYLTLIILTGLPVLSFLMLLGSMEPIRLTGGFLVTGMVLLSLGSVSLFNSAFMGKARTAVIVTYVQVIIYLGICLCHPSWFDSANIVTSIRELMKEEGTASRSGSFQPRTLLNASPPTVGSALAVIDTIRARLAANGTCLGLVSLLSLSGAIVGVRFWTKKLVEQRGRRTFRVSFRLLRKRRPRVGNCPLLWKELHAEPIFRFGMASMVVAGSLGIVGTLFAGYFFLTLILFGEMQGFQIGVTALACLLLLAIGLRAAGSIRGERERGTLESLLTTPLGTRSILGAKWIGSILSVRKPLCFLMAVWFLGAVVDAMSFLCLFLSLVGWLVYAAFLASLGLYFSTTVRTSLRAMAWTLGVVLVMSVITWVIDLFLPLFYQVERDRAWFETASWLALSPPTNLQFLANPYKNGGDYQLHDLEKAAPLRMSLTGLGIYFLASLYLYLLAAVRLKFAYGVRQRKR
jgi:ABC-type transport system involved in multi-copper enzyme maturation permease subunit